MNMDGPVVASLNEHDKEVVTLAVPESVAWLGAHVTAKTDNGDSYTREVINAVGMQTDQSPHISFAIPRNGSINSLEISFADGTSKTIVPDGPGLIQP